MQNIKCCKFDKYKMSLETKHIMTTSLLSIPMKLYTCHKHNLHRLFKLKKYFKKHFKRYSLSDSDLAKFSKKFKRVNFSQLWCCRRGRAGGGGCGATLIEIVTRFTRKH